MSTRTGTHRAATVQKASRSLGLQIVMGNRMSPAGRREPVSLLSLPSWAPPGHLLAIGRHVCAFLEQSCPWFTLRKGSHHVQSDAGTTGRSAQTQRQRAQTLAHEGSSTCVTDFPRERDTVTVQRVKGLGSHPSTGGGDRCRFCRRKRPGGGQQAPAYGHFAPVGARLYSGFPSPGCVCHVM